MLSMVEWKAPTLHFAEEPPHLVPSPEILHEAVGVAPPRAAHGLRPGRPLAQEPAHLTAEPS